MPKVVETAVYECHELPTEKAKARDWLREVAVSGEWHKQHYEDAVEVGLKITGFDHYRKELTFELETSTPGVAESVVEKHDAACETYKAAHNYLRELESLGDRPSDEDPHFADDIWETKREELDNGFLKEFGRCYTNMLRSRKGKNHAPPRP